VASKNQTPPFKSFHGSYLKGSSSTKLSSKDPLLSTTYCLVFMAEEKKEQGTNPPQEQPLPSESYSSSFQTYSSHIG